MSSLAARLQSSGSYSSTCTSRRERMNYLISSSRTTSSLSRLINMRLFSLLLLLVLYPNVCSLPLLRDQQSQAANHENNHLTLTQERDFLSNRNSLDVKRSSGGQQDGSVPRSKRAVIVDEDGPIRLVGYWKDALVPYEFDASIRDAASGRTFQNKVIKAMKTWEKHTCIRFVKRKAIDTKYLRISFDDQSCSATIGFKRFQSNKMSLTEDCLRSKGSIVHELGHVLGFYHEHQRPDRDDYIVIHWDNIIDSDFIRRQYEIRNDSDSLGTAYDFNSIMHWSTKHGAINASLPTFSLKDPNSSVSVNRIGQRSVLSKTDKKQTNLLYQCGKDLYSNKTLARRREVVKTSNYIEHGDHLSFRVNSNGSCSWMGCSTHSCSLSTCPGKILRPNDRDKCPHVVNRIQKINNSIDYPYISVGDQVYLQKLNFSGESLACQTLFSGGNCSFRSSSHCTSDTNRFNSFLCRDRVLVVRSNGKKEGERIKHKDEIWFEFLESDSAYMYMLVCEGSEDISSSRCRKVRKLLNLQVSGSSGVNKSPTNFSIYKF